MVRCILRRRKSLRLAFAAGIAVWTLAGTAALAQTPACNGKNVYPCSIGGTLLVSNKPVLTFSGGSGILSFGGGGGVFTNDPQNPGITATGFGNLVAVGPLLPSALGTFSLATLSGQSTITGASASITCGVTGAATYNLTLTTPGGPLVLNCPHVAAPGTAVTVTGQMAFSPLSSLAMTLTLSGTATSGADTMTLSAFSAQVQISSAGCTSAVSPGGVAFGPEGGGVYVNIATSQGCPWAVSNIPSWVTVTGAASGAGNGAVPFVVGANAGADRSATIVVAGVSFTVEQGGTIPGLNLVGSMPHIAAQENWTTMFTLVNKGGTSTQARLSVFGDVATLPGGGPLMVPLAFPQQPPAAGPLLTTSLDRTLNANASLVINTAGAQTPPVLVGSAQVAATGPVDGFAIFHHVVSLQEAVVPLETRNPVLTRWLLTTPTAWCWGWRWRMSRRRTATSSW